MLHGKQGYSTYIKVKALSYKCVIFGKVGQIDIYILNSICIYINTLSPRHKGQTLILINYQVLRLTIIQVSLKSTHNLSMYIYRVSQSSRSTCKRRIGHVILRHFFPVPLF